MMSLKKKMKWLNFKMMERIFILINMLILMKLMMMGISYLLFLETYLLDAGISGFASV